MLENNKVLKNIYINDVHLDTETYFAGSMKDIRIVGGSYVMTEASAMKACAVASFLIHLTATLVPL